MTGYNQGSNPLDANTDDDQDNDGDDAFPTDATEWDDTDSDGVGDNADLCDNTSDPENTDTDGDSIGNACDDDDDNDGVADELEDSLGSDSLDTDSDDDGLEDWFGETMEVGQDPCLLDPDTSSTTDQDGDGFTTTCDLSDDSSIDPSADEVNYLAIFVDATNGNDSNDGSITSPVQTLDKAGELAESEDKNVYATGDYELTETLDLPDGVFFYGGFADDFLSRDPENSPSAISSTTLSVLIEADDTTEGTGMNGFTMINDYTGNEAWGVLVMDGEFVLSHSSIQMGNADYLYGLDAEEANVTLTAISIELSDHGSSDPARAAYGLYLSEAEGTLNNSSTITIGDYPSRRAIHCVAEGENNFVVDTITIDVFETTETADNDFVYITDCNGTHYDSNDVSLPSLNGLDVSGLTVDGLF